MTRWWQGWLTTLTDDMANLLWRPMWLLHLTTQVMTKTQPQQPWRQWVTTFDDQCEDLLMTLEIPWQHLTTPSGDIYRQSQKFPVLPVQYFWQVMGHSRSFFNDHPVHDPINKYHIPSLYILQHTILANALLLRIYYAFMLLVHHSPPL